MLKSQSRLLKLPQTPAHLPILDQVAPLAQLAACHQVLLLPHGELTLLHVCVACIQVEAEWQNVDIYFLKPVDGAHLSSPPAQRQPGACGWLPANQQTKNAQTCSDETLGNTRAPIASPWPTAASRLSMAPRNVCCAEATKPCCCRPSPRRVSSALERRFHRPARMSSSASERYSSPSAWKQRQSFFFFQGRVWGVQDGGLELENWSGAAPPARGSSTSPVDGWLGSAGAPPTPPTNLSTRTWLCSGGMAMCHALHCPPAHNPYTPHTHTCGNSCTWLSSSGMAMCHALY